MKIETLIKYEESYLPSRCRKLRYRECEEKVNINLKEVKLNELRLAFEDNSYEGEGKIYFFRNKLWRKAKVRDICAGDETEYKDPLSALIYWRKISSWFFPRGWRDGDHPDKKHMIKIAKKETEQYLLVDGELYTQTKEPRYVINTFGLGHNHGGTGMFCEYGYNPNISKECYFSALEGDMAVKKANEIAARRGDTKDVGKFKPFIKCYAPDLVKVKPNKQHGNGNEFHNMLETVIENSSSQGEAAITCMCMAMMNV